MNEVTDASNIRSFYVDDKLSLISKEFKQKLRSDIYSNKEGVKESLRQLTSEEIFGVFDDDDSGLISFEEFRKMLPFLGIIVNDAKAYRYFRLCDIDDSGHIDVDEFKIVLFLCDPSSGNQVGYSPKKYITPLDAFELFDEDHSGDMDEDEFAYAMEYIGVKLSDSNSEQLFRERDLDGSGKIVYEEFRDAFLEVCNLKAELELRNIDVPLFSNKSKLRQLLRNVILEEEAIERLAVTETLKYKSWLSAVKDKKIYIERAKFRAYHELRRAIDLAGQVYVFGDGYNNQFSGKPIDSLHTQNYQYKHFKDIVKIWCDRIRPDEVVEKLSLQRKSDQLERKRELDRRKRRQEDVDEDLFKPNYILDPYLEAKHSLFKNLNVAVNTAGLYGKRIHQVSACENVLFALSENGDIYSWGGQRHSWHQIQPDSTKQSKWRGDTTPRSQLLLGTTDKQFPDEDREIENFNLPEEEMKIEILKVITKYFNVWEPPPDPTSRLLFMEKILLPKVSFEDLKFGLLCRGKVVETGSKLELIEMLYRDIVLEKKLLGDKAHRAIKTLETQVSSLIKRKKDYLAKKILKRIEEIWKPLREVQDQHRIEINENEKKVAGMSQIKSDNDYLNWRQRINDSVSQTMYKGFIVNGITPRGNELYTPRSNARVKLIASGATHACAIHVSGQLYSWGVGLSGRLGNSSIADESYPCCIEAVKHLSMVDISCGYSHSGAVTHDGNLYMWGSANHGKLGVGKLVEAHECFTNIPIKISFFEERKIVKISCGYAHSAIVTESGQLYVFGCGDGGRLGLGNSNLGTVYTPTLVSAVQHEKIVSVTCGNCSTIACTRITYESINDDGHSIIRRIGGRVYIAGSSNVFGQDYTMMTLLEDMKNIPVVQASAGYRHSALVSAEGELFCWGSNFRGCCGFNLDTDFVHKPSIIKAMYYQPENLALGANCYQSSTFNERHAFYAINGKKDGHGLLHCSCTQEESHAWIEVDLGFEAVIDDIWIWNRVDSPKSDLGLPSNFFTKRLFPMWVMIGNEEFEKSTNMSSYIKNLSRARAKINFVEDRRVSKWKCGGICGQFIRIQLQDCNFLNIAELEVFGRPRIAPGVGKVTSVCAGRDVTAAVVCPPVSPEDLEIAFKRAVRCDSLNADILRELEIYARPYENYSKLGKSNELICSVCSLSENCESCSLLNKYKEELASLSEPMSTNRLDSVCNTLLRDLKLVLPPLQERKQRQHVKWKSLPPILRNMLLLKGKSS